jgi:serine protease inhibitor
LKFAADQTLSGRPPVFQTDHPFMFAIYDVKTGMIMFLGRVGKP